MDARRLSNAIIKGLKSGVDIGDDKTFLAQEYGKIQHAKNLSMMGMVLHIFWFIFPCSPVSATLHTDALEAPNRTLFSLSGSVDFLDRIFSSDLKSVSFLRSFGMLGIHGLGPVKAQIAKFAMGHK